MQIHFVLVCLGPSPTKGCSCIVLIAIDVYLCHVSRIGQSRKTCSTDWGSCQVTGVIHGVFGDWLEELIKRSVKACSVITLRAILLYVFVWSDHITWPVMCPIVDRSCRFQRRLWQKLLPTPDDARPSPVTWKECSYHSIWERRLWNDPRYQSGYLRERGLCACILCVYPRSTRHSIPITFSYSTVRTKLPYSASRMATPSQRDAENNQMILNGCVLLVPACG